jgi:hypothetical protein
MHETQISLCQEVVGRQPTRLSCTQNARVLFQLKLEYKEPVCSELDFCFLKNDGVRIDYSIGLF